MTTLNAFTEDGLRSFLRRRVKNLTGETWRELAEMFPAVHPSGGAVLVCPASNSDEDEYCLTTFIHMPYDTLEQAKVEARPEGEDWAPWAR